jgi:hypothetical protein
VVGVACVAIVSAGAAGCSSNSPISGPGQGGSTGHGGTGGRPTISVGGAAGSSFGGAGGAVAGGASGVGSGGAGGAPGGGAVGTSAGGAGGKSVGGASGMAVGGAGGAPAGGAAGTTLGGSGGGPGVGGAAGTPAGGMAGSGGQGQAGCQVPSGPAGSWVEVPAPSGQSGFRVSDAFAVGTDDLLFAGSTVDPTTLTAPTNAQVLRWTQGCWTVELTFPPSATAPGYPSVHGTGPNDLWATASDLLYHRDSQGWTAFADQSWRTLVRQPPSFLEPIEFHRVRAAVVNDFWIAASSNILHWSGQSWTTYNFDDPNYPMTESVGYNFTDIWIDSPSSVWVVGPSDQVGNTMSQGFVHHFDGANWTHTAAGVGGIDAIWRGGAVLWLAQPTEADVNGQTETLTLRAFDGTSAPAVQIAGVDPTQNSVLMSSLFGRGASDVWAAGGDVAHFDGQSWSLVTDAPAPARDAGNFTAEIVTGDAGSVWLVTPGPRFFRKVTGP